jgi:hypothetical protein
MAWESPRPGGAGISAAVPGIDASLILADATGWRDFRRLGEDPPVTIPVVAEVKAGRLAELGRIARVPAVYVDDASSPLIVSATVAPGTLGRILDRGGPVARLELQAPYVPQRPRSSLPASAALPTEDPPQSTSRVLIGVIDQGCPFAHADLRAVGGGTRILSLWLQDERHAEATRRIGTTPAPFGRGIQLTRSRLDGLIARHTDVDGRVDEAACHEAAGLRELRRRMTHGGGVLSLVAGTRPATIRIEPPRKPGSAPVWIPPQPLRALEDEASRSDIVFVQPPRDALQDSSSGSLGRYVLDALAYIVSCAGPKTDRIVINISDGSSRGPHDGTWMLTRAMEAMVAAERRRGRDLRIVIAAGNSADEERHAQIDRIPPGRTAGVTLRVQPGSEMPTQVVIRIPAAAKGLEMRIVPPVVGSDRASAGIIRQGEARCWPSAGAPECIAVYPKAAAGAASSEALVSWAPTERLDAAIPRATAGNWRIDFFAPGGCDAPIHLYVPRSQTNPGAQCRGRQAVFVDVSPGSDYDPRRWLRAAEQDPSPVSSPIRRSGTLNALATGHSGVGIEVVGATFAREASRTIYSSHGPTVRLPGQTQPSRLGPDCLRPADVARAARGIPVGGSTGRQIVRVTGTSFAAPQRAREIANEAFPDRMRRGPNTGRSQGGTRRRRTT